MISEQAVLRLQSMVDLTSLGSGFDLASRDLEIRGAGSLFGLEQSGSQGRVGYDFYMTLLQRSIKASAGIDLVETARCSVDLGLSIDGDGPSIGSIDDFVVPKSYISETKVREMESNKAKLARTSDEIVALTESWKKDFGPLPKSLKKDLKNLHLHACCRTLGVDGITREGSAIVLTSPNLRPRHVKLIKSRSKNFPPGVEVSYPPEALVQEQEEEMLEGEGIFEMEELISYDPEDGIEDLDIGTVPLDARKLVTANWGKSSNNNGSSDGGSSDGGSSDGGSPTPGSMDINENNSNNNTNNGDIVPRRKVLSPTKIFIPLTSAQLKAPVTPILKILLPISSTILSIRNEAKEKAMQELEQRDEFENKRAARERQVSENARAEGIVKKNWRSGYFEDP